jgi:hypothetical protein
MEAGSAPESNEAGPLQGSEEQREVERASGWNPEETVPVRAGSESRELAERAERLRLVSGRRRALQARRSR